MPSDYVTLKALAAETDGMLSEGKINKINMPYPDTLTLQIRAKGNNYTLLISAAGGKPRFYLTDSKGGQGGAEPPAFCMLLRKHLTGGTVEFVRMFCEDRVIEIKINAKNELYDSVTFSLLYEITGGNSNIILTDGGYKIIDASYRIFGESKRQIFPSFPYIPLPNNKRLLSDGEYLSSVSSLSSERLAEELLKNASGLSKESVREIVLLSEKRPLTEIVSDFSDIYGKQLLKPCIAVSDGKASGVFAFPYKSVLKTWVSYNTINAAFDDFYRVSAAETTKMRETAHLRTLVKRLKTKYDKKLAFSAEKLSETDKIENALQQAEILKCNLYNAKKGDSILKCYDFYNNSDIEIQLDALLTPAKNLESFYKRYHKLLGAKNYAEKEIKEVTELSEYLKTLEESVFISSSQEEYAEIETELLKLDGKSFKIKQNKKIKKSTPLSVNIEGYRVYIGKNNLQNDEVTFKLADGGDLWLHAKDYHGSHVVIKCGGKKPPLSVIEKAASLAAYYSKAREQLKAEVVYTERKNVKRLQKAGLVNYTAHKSIQIFANECADGVES